MLNTDAAYRFEGYERLKHLLPDYGLSLAIPDIDRHLAVRNDKDPTYSTAQVSIGEVRVIETGASVSRIYYIKLAISDVVRQRFEDPEVRKIGVEYDRRISRAIKRGGCSAAAAVDGGFEPKSFVYEVGDYEAWALNSKARWLSRNFPIVNRYESARYDFPQTTTFDQSFFLDQTDAFIGLGYLQGIGMDSIRKPR